ncbi:MAG: hypothetical protein AB7N70_16745 [Dehalococcoidia bacterium]
MSISDVDIERFMQETIGSVGGERIVAGDPLGAVRLGFAWR